MSQPAPVMATRKYLHRYAEPESGQCTDFPRRYRHVLCIPAFAEPANFLAATLARVQSPELLVILVANASTAASARQQAQTQAIVTCLTQECGRLSRLADNIHLLDGDGGADILLVDRCSPGLFIAEKDGVGRARKIACDMACRLAAEGIVASPWIHSTDADCTLPADYFRAVEKLDADVNSAGIYPFQHAPHQVDTIRQAQALYDASLDYYVSGLRWSGSPYAFHTIGSTLAISAAHYARVRGFPVRRAGEDFYLLNKLAKTGRVVPLDSSPLLLETRVSDRVPFGTGPALGKILAMDDPRGEFLFYHPHCFVYLKCWLTLARTMWQGKPRQVDAALIGSFMGDNPEYGPVEAAVLDDCLRALGIDRTLAHAHDHSKSKQVFVRHLHNGFDAFQTLKFIHWLRDNHLPSLSGAAIRDGTYPPFAAVPGMNVPAPPAWTPPPRSPRQNRQAR